MSLEASALTRFVDQTFSDSIVPALTEYIRIPNKSPMFDPDWKKHGHMARAVELIRSWCEKHAPKGAKIEVLSEGERTPLLLIDVPGKSDDTVLLYGHLDKQPEMTGWSEGLGPWTPVLRGDKLFGRGAADDGYAAFSSLTAINALQKQDVPHSRCVVLIEACEESGSYDLPYYIDKLAPRLGQPSLIVCLDAGCGNYDQMWMTTSLRGVVTANLKVELVKEGVHSGDASGIVADSFRVLRALLSRIERESDGKILLPGYEVDIPKGRVAEAELVAKVLGDAVYSKFPFHEGVKPIENNYRELILNRTWRPSLSVVGAEGLPKLADAGNVCRPYTSVKLSLRLPPTADADAACATLKKVLLADPPYGAKVTVDDVEGAAGWNAPPTAEWLEQMVREASKTYFNAEPMWSGEGGSIPFMGMLGKKFPEAQFVITGVLGPGSNAHGPNEFLHIPTARKLTQCVAHVLARRAAMGKK
jgi:acetylornithine deacetylase/succinyl-diaminopimelate desuccinylase-like protein